MGTRHEARLDELGMNQAMLKEATHTLRNVRVGRGTGVKAFDHPCFILPLSIHVIKTMIGIRPEIQRFTHKVWKDNIRWNHVLGLHCAIVADSQWRTVYRTSQWFPNTSTKWLDECDMALSHQVMTYLMIWKRFLAYFSAKSGWKSLRRRIAAAAV